MNTKNTFTRPVKKVCINSPLAFEEWAKSLRMFGANDESKTYVFDLSELSFYENVNISTQVDYYHTACGNKTRSFLMSVTFLSLIAGYFIAGGTFSEITLTQILSCIAITIISAFLGKIIGVLNAHWNLIKLAKDMQRRLNIDNHYVKTMQISKYETV